ncbi:MAG: hypothetical protein J4N87_04920 [Chloroflexi bacterium]|nr:hypothetical protein [Chloroflexota bacterium]
MKALFQKIGDQPGGHEFRCFAIDIDSAAASTRVGEYFLNLGVEGTLD